MRKALLPKAKSDLKGTNHAGT